MNPSTEYEKLVQSIVQDLLKEQGISVKVEHDIEIPDRNGINRQVDVYWEYRVAGVLHRVAIECKCWKRRIEIGDVDAIKGRMVETPGIRYVLVTTVGFQEGAELLAKNNDIVIYEIRPPVDADYDGRVKTIEITFILRPPPEFVRVDTKINLDWYNTNKTPAMTAHLGSQILDTHATVIEDHDQNSTATLMQVLNNSVTHFEPGDYQTVVPFSNAFLRSEDLPPIKLDSITIDYRISNKSPSTQVIRLESGIASAIVRDSISGHTIFYNANSQFTGDVDHFISQPKV